MNDFFISYARSSSALEAKALHEKLTQKGYSVFLDEKEIPPGSVFPQYLADGLNASRIIIVLATDLYFKKPWCVREFQTILLPYTELLLKTNDPANALDHIMILFQKDGTVEHIGALLPPQLTIRSWPREHESDTAADLAIRLLQNKGSHTATEDDSNTSSGGIRNAGLVPAAARPSSVSQYLTALPQTLGDDLFGREESLWQIHYALELRAADDNTRSLVIEGSGGMGKTQLAAEYVHRYGFRFYTGGIIWIDASGDEDHLLQQFTEVLKIFAPLSSGAGSLELAALKLQSCFAALPQDKKYLWVIDNIPEPQKGQSPHRLDHWCPARKNVSILGTSRQAGIKDADHLLRLRELTEDAALNMLVQPLVQKKWLNEDDWKIIVKWVGALPIALRILHTSLADGYLRPEDLLKKANGDDPSLVLDDEADSIKEEVADEYLRSIAEVFSFSYEALQNYPDALSALKFISLLAKAPVPESLLLRVCDTKSLAILAKRSWISPIAGDSDVTERHYSIHRIAASYNRNKALPADYILCCDQFIKIFSEQLSTDELRRAERNFRVFSRYLANYMHVAPDALLRAKTVEMGVSISRKALGNSSWNGLGFMVANFMDAIQAGDELVDALGKDIGTILEEEALQVVHILSGLYNSEAAARFFETLFHDERDRVRWLSFIHASYSSHSEILLSPLLQALMLETNKNVLTNSAGSFAALLRNGQGNGIRDLISNVANYYSSDPDGLHRKLLVEVLGSTIDVFGTAWTTQGWTADHVIGFLVEVAVREQDPEVRAAALTALSYKEDPKIFLLLQEQISKCATAEAYANAVGVYLTYILQFERPPRPVMKWEEEDGAFLLKGTLPQAQHREDLYNALIHFIANEPNEDKLAAGVHELFKVQNAKASLSNAIYQLMDGDGKEQVVKICNCIVQVNDEMVINGYWWRGQALYQLGGMQDACNDFTNVLAISPTYIDAYHWRGLCNLNLKDFSNARADLEKVLQQYPDDTSIIDILKQIP
jgi:tetratricopeptide (TPR) repeat protein